MLDDIINGTYDSAKGIPGTYSEAWEQAISEAWESIVEQSDAVPGEREKDKPSEGDEDEKDDPEGGGGDSGGSNNDQEEPPEGGRFTEEEIQEILKEMTPELLREYIYEINLIRYGDKLDPSFEYFTDKLGKSFEEIIDSASRPNIYIDKLLEGFEEWLRRQW